MSVSTVDPAVRDVLTEALHAPSAHNTQPWWYAVQDGAIDLVADRTRALPVNDPFDRELTISCGASLCTLEIACLARGWWVDTVMLPDPSEPDLLAHVTCRAGTAQVRSADAALDRAIRQRHTYRGPFARSALPAGLTARLESAVEHEGARLVRIDGTEARADLAAVVAEADRVQFGDPSWRRELAVWMHPDREDDGMPLQAGSELGTRLAPTMPGERITVATPDPSLVTEAPMVVVLATERDRTSDWLVAGRALQRMLLTAASEGIQASYLNQACQVTSARTGVRYLIGGQLHPQAILRLGVPARPIRRTARRSLETVLRSV